MTAAVVPGLGSRVIVDGNIRIHNQTSAALSVGVYPGGRLSFNPARPPGCRPPTWWSSGRAGVGYWFNGGGGNTYEDNVAAAVAECTYCYGFKFDNVYNGTVTIPAFRGADPHQARASWSTRTPSA